MDPGYFEVVYKVEADGKHIYRHSFVDKLKVTGEKKSRLCVAAFNYQDQARLLQV